MQLVVSRGVVGRARAWGVRRSVRVAAAAAAAAAAVAGVLPSAASAQQWSGGTGAWNTPENWTPAGVPASGAGTQLSFSSADATGYTATNDIGAFTLNKVTFGNTGTGALAVTGGTLTLAGTTPTFDVTGTATLGSALSTAAGYTKTGTGTLILTGTNTAVAGTATTPVVINLNQGTLQIATANNLGTGTASALTVNFAGGTLRTTAGFSNGANVQNYNFVAGTTSTLDVTGALGKQGNSFSGAGNWVKTGSGQLSIGSAGGAAFTGSVTVDAGVLRFTSQRLSAAGGFTVNAGGQILINDDATGTFSIAAGKVMTLSGSGPAGNASPGALVLTDQSATATTNGGPVDTWSNGVVLAADASVGVYNGAGASGSVRTSSLIFSGAVTGPGSLTKLGNGLLTLSNAGNTYGGAAGGTTTVAAGTLKIAGGANRVSTTTGLVLGSATANTSGTFDLNGQSQTVAGLSTAGTGTANAVVSSIAGSPVLTVNYAGATPQTYAGALGGTGANNNAFGFTKGGTGRLDLTGAVTYTGPTTVTGGTLGLGATTTLAASPAITVASGAVVDASANSAGLALGAGQSLTAGRTGAAAADVVGGLSLAGSSLNVGGTGTPATLTVGGGLSLAGGAAVTFDIGATTTPGGGVSDLVAVNGNLTLADTTGVTLLPTAGQIANGTYTLITYTGALGGTASNLAVAGGAGTTRQTFAFSTATPGQVKVTVAGASASLVWAGGAGTSTWDLPTAAGATANWTNGAAADKFYNFDSVAFTDAGAVAEDVSIAAEVRPTAVTVNAARDYAFSGPGFIAGATGLTKSGTGTLTINTPNTFTGQTVVTAGTLSFGAGGRIGGTLTVNGGTVNGIGGAVAGAVVVNDGTLNGGGNDSFTGPVTVNGGTVNGAAGSFTAPVTINGGTVNGGPAGSTTPSFSGNIALNGGTLVATSKNNFADTVIFTFNGGTFRADGVYSTGSGLQPWVFGAAGGTIDVSVLGSVTKQGNSVSGTGPIRKTGDGVLSIGSNVSPFSGTVAVDAGVLRLTSNQLRFATGATIADGAAYQITDDGGTYAAPATFNLAAGSELVLRGNGQPGSTTPGAMVLTDQSPNDGALSGPKTQFPTNVRLAADATVAAYNGQGTAAGHVSALILTGQVTGPGKLTKAGTGVVGVAGANDYAGGTAVTSGTLLVMNATGSGTGPGPVAVDAGATLGGTGTFAGAVSITGTLAPGVTAAGRLTGNGTVALALGSVFVAEVGKVAADGQAPVAGADYDQLALKGTGATLAIAPGAVLNVTELANVAGGQVFTVVDNTAGGTIAGTFVDAGGTPLTQGATVVGSGGTQFLVSYAGGDVTLTALPIPEPGSVAAGGLAAAGLLARRRRRHR